MLTYCVEDASIAMCENTKDLVKFMFGWKGMDRIIYEFAGSTVFVLSLKLRCYK